MVKIGLQLKATLNNIEEFKTCGEDFQWYLKFTCTNCCNVTDKWNNISLSEIIPAQHGYTDNHFVYKCKLCSRVNSMQILKDSLQSYTVYDENKFKTMAIFECRGMEPTEFSVRDGWDVKVDCGIPDVTNIDLSDKEWYDYCEQKKDTISIEHLEYRFERIK